MGSHLPKSVEFLISFQFGGELSQELHAFAYSTHIMRHVGVNVCSFWQELVTMARRVHIEVRLPMIVAGDANVWHPHFTLGRSRSADHMIVPFIDLLISSCGLVLCKTGPPTLPVRPLIWFVPSSSPVIVRVHDGDTCCCHAPACCPLLGSDHFFCVGTTSFPRPGVSVAPSGIPLLRDWRPTLLRAFSQLSLWAKQLLQQSSSEQSP